MRVEELQRFAVRRLRIVNKGTPLTWARKFERTFRQHRALRFDGVDDGVGGGGDNRLPFGDERLVPRPALGEADVLRLGHSVEKRLRQRLDLRDAGVVLGTRREQDLLARGFRTEAFQAQEVERELGHPHVVRQRGVVLHRIDRLLPERLRPFDELVIQRLEGRASPDAERIVWIGRPRGLTPVHLLEVRADERRRLAVVTREEIVD